MFKKKYEIKKIFTETVENKRFRYYAFDETMTILDEILDFAFLTIFFSICTCKSLFSKNNDNESSCNRLSVDSSHYYLYCCRDGNASVYLALSKYETRYQLIYSRCSNRIRYFTAF